MRVQEDLTHLTCRTAVQYIRVNAPPMASRELIRRRLLSVRKPRLGQTPGPSGPRKLLTERCEGSDSG